MVKIKENGIKEIKVRKVFFVKCEFCVILFRSNKIDSGLINVKKANQLWLKVLWEKVSGFYICDHNGKIGFLRVIMVKLTKLVSLGNP